MKRAKKPNYRQPVSIACLGLLGLSSAPADAQTKTPPPIVNLPEVVVAGKNAPVPATEKSLTVPSVSAAQEAVKKIPGGATVVPAEEFKTGRASTLKDVLDYAPGVFTQSRFGSDEARISIRGSGLQRTFHGRGLKLLQDGVPLNLADGGFDMQAIEPLSAEYVEVLRGANALRYGSTTLGGAVNFVTPTGHTADKAQARAEYGSYNYWRGQISTGMTLGPVDYYATATHYSTDGFRRHAEQSNQRVFANVGYKLSDNAETRMYFTYVQTYSELPGSLTKAEMEANPRQANTNPSIIAGNQKRNFELVRAANKTTWSQGHNTIELGSFWSHKDLDHPIFQVIDQNSNDLGVEARFRNDADLFGRRNNFVLGLSPTYGWAEDNRFTNLLGRRGPRTGESTQTSYNLDCYGENTHQIADRLALILGMQVSYANRDFQDRFLADGNQTANPDYLGFNPKVGLRYDFDDKNQVFANVSRSFEPPSFGELSRPPGATPVNGLLPLKAQTATTIEFGTRGSHGRVGWEAVYYHAWLQDELLSLSFPRVPDGVLVPTTVNANRTTHSGIELGWNARVLEDLTTAGNAQRDGDRVVFRNAYQWNRFRFDGDNAFGNNQLPGMPEHYFRAELTYEHPCGFYAGPNVEWAIQKSPVDMANTLFVDPYAILGLKVGYRVKKGISGYVEVRNVTDERYAATTGVITRATAANGAQFNPGDGRTVYLGLEYKW